MAVASKNNLPIVQPDPTTRARIEAIARRLIVRPFIGSAAERTRWETELDAEVCRLYGLTPDEIALIESSSNDE